jgi:hypothetical protein
VESPAKEGMSEELVILPAAPESILNWPALLVYER